MKIIDILRFMGELGWRYSKKEIPAIEYYFSRMVAEGRVLTLYENSLLRGILVYSICKDTLPFIQKSDWTYLPQEKYGTNIFIEHMAVKEFNREIFKEFYERITQKHPHWERALWKRYRQKSDKLFIIKREGIYARN